MKLCSIWCLLNLLLLSHAQVPCPNGWLASEFSGTCLMAFSSGVPFISARSICQILGGDLLIISNEKMNTFVRDALDVVKDGTSYLIGLNDVGRNGYFKWLDYPEKVEFTKLVRSQQGPTKSCAVLSHESTGEWHESRCLASSPYICEKFTDCPPGYFGQNCSKRCDLYCSGLEEVCLNTNGICTRGCDGNRKPWCQTACPQGKYGVSCSENCSINCVGEQDNCDRVHGECRGGCVSGHEGKMCHTSCPQGKYGVNCNKNCSIHCVGEQDNCDRVYGECQGGCVAGYEGKLCNTPCPQGKFGVSCSENCSINCVGEQDNCDRVHGECEGGCVAGYEGKLCNTRSRAKEGIYSTDAIVFAGIFALVVLLALLCLIPFVNRHMNNHESEPEGVKIEGQREMDDEHQDESEELDQPFEEDEPDEEDDLDYQEMDDA